MDELLKETKEMMKGHVPSSSVINLEKYVNAGLKSADFIDLLCKLTNHIEHMMGVKAEDSASSRALATYWKNGSTTGILLMVSKLLKSLGCNHKCLTEGPVKTRLNSKRARLLLVHFFVSKAKSFEADVIPVQVDTMDKLKEVIQSGEEFYVVNDEVLNSKLFQTFRAELDRDHAKSEQDLREDKKRGETRNSHSDNAVSRQKNDRIIREDEMKLAEDIKTLKKKAKQISDWFFRVKANLVRMQETNNAQMKKILEEEENKNNQNLETIIRVKHVKQMQDKILSQTIKEIFEDENMFDNIFEIFDLLKGLGPEADIKVKLKWFDKARQLVEEIPFESFKQVVEGRLKEFYKVEKLNLKIEKLDLQIEKLDLQIEQEIAERKTKKIQRLDLQIEQEKLRLEKLRLKKEFYQEKLRLKKEFEQESGSTPPVSSSTPPATPPSPSSSQEEPTAADGATAVTGAKAAVEKDARICWSCHAKEKLFKCRGCFIGWYCDMECQAADWSRHSKFCLKTQEKRKRNMRRNRRSSDKYVPSVVSEVD